ncbi:hypothetical protein LSH36_425g02071, partial [Paralvinella palmiformis]
NQSTVGRTAANTSSDVIQVVLQKESEKTLGVGVMCVDTPDGKDAIFVENIVPGSTASKQKILG